jgi:opine dehydrogenase
MEIAVLGGGHGCYAAVAELSQNGHSVRWWRRQGQSHQAVLDDGGIKLTDYRGERRLAAELLTDDLGAAVGGAGLILIPLPATTHSDLAPRLAEVLEPGQVVYLPPGTFGSCVFAKALYDCRPGIDVSFAETGTLPYLARKHGESEVVVSGYATRLPTGVFPACNTDHALSILERAYPSIERSEDGLSGALMNAGPVIHPPLIIMNAGPLEHFPHWDIHNEGTQPSVRKVTTALDNERINLRKALGYGAPHFPLSDHYSTDGDEWMYGRAAHQKLTDSGDWREKIELMSHRYMLEDVALGLSFLVSVAHWSGNETPVAAGLLAIGSAITGRDLYAEGRTLENLGLADLSRDQMRELLINGF